MASLDSDLVRHALKTAREHGFAEVDLGLDGSLFRARLEPGPKKPVEPPVILNEAEMRAKVESDFKLIKSPIVGFYREGPTQLEPGKTVKPADIVAVINALGIANDVEAQVTGEIAEVLVTDGQAVEFGQVLAKVKP
jgi:acetyl-CoA carboxylase biotin carboxyl carrier protein